MNQFTLIEKAFRSVSVSEQLVQEFMMAALGIPLPKHHAPNIMAIFMERIWRVYRIHPEFVEMPTQLQLELITTNSALGMAMLALKSENCKSFSDQLQAGFGELDDQRWKELYMPLAEKVKNVPSVRMQHATDTKSVSLTPEDFQNYQIMSKSSSYLVSEPWLFKICLLLILTLPQDSIIDGKVCNALHSKYLTILRRRLNWMSLKKSTERRLQSQTDQEFELAKVMEGIQSLKIFSKIVNQLTKESL